MNSKTPEIFDLQLPSVIDGHITRVRATCLGFISTNICSARLDWLDYEKYPSLAKIRSIYGTLALVYPGLVIGIHPETRIDEEFTNFLRQNYDGNTAIDRIQFNSASPITLDSTKNLIIRFLTLLNSIL